MPLPKSKFNLNVNLALKQECKCRQLQPIELHSFRGNPSEFQQQYEMEYLLGVLIVKLNAH